MKTIPRRRKAIESGRAINDSIIVIKVLVYSFLKIINTLRYHLMSCNMWDFAKYFFWTLPTPQIHTKREKEKYKHTHTHTQTHTHTHTCKSIHNLNPTTSFSPLCFSTAATQKYAKKKITCISKFGACRLNLRH